MARTFFPRKSVNIPASKPHPDGTEYKISVGDEDWDAVFQSVIKVQVVYDDKIAVRKSPSYPVGSDDWKRVADAIDKLLREEKGKNLQHAYIRGAAYYANLGKKK
ncbi:MAG TPA: hypothetical protein VFF80_03555 [Bacillota bacterium]|nr:hypothetical protein [Bacillota bacterium]